MRTKQSPLLQKTYLGFILGNGLVHPEWKSFYIYVLSIESLTTSHRAFHLYGALGFYFVQGFMYVCLQIPIAV